MSPKETDLKRLINKAAQFSEMRATAKPCDTCDCL